MWVAVCAPLGGVSALIAFVGGCFFYCLFLCSLHGDKLKCCSVFTHGFLWRLNFWLFLCIKKINQITLLYCCYLIVHMKGFIFWRRWTVLHLGDCSSTCYGGYLTSPPFVFSIFGIFLIGHQDPAFMLLEFWIYFGGCFSFCFIFLPCSLPWVVLTCCIVFILGEVWRLSLCFFLSFRTTNLSILLLCCYLRLHLRGSHPWRCWTVLFLREYAILCGGGCSLSFLAALGIDGLILIILQDATFLLLEFWFVPPILCFLYYINHYCAKLMIMAFVYKVFSCGSTLNCFNTRGFLNLDCFGFGLDGALFSFFEAGFFADYADFAVLVDAEFFVTGLRESQQWHIFFCGRLSVHHLMSREDQIMSFLVVLIFMVYPLISKLLLFGFLLFFLSRCLGSDSLAGDNWSRFVLGVALLLFLDVLFCFPFLWMNFVSSQDPGSIGLDVALGAVVWIQVPLWTL